MKAIAAIDGGGTKTDCLVAGLDGECLGHGSGGPAVPLYVPWERAVESVRTALGDAVAMAPDSVEIEAISGSLPCGAEVVHEVARENGCPVEAVWSVDEAVACLAAAGKSRGLVIMAGTGSFAAVVDDSRHVTYTGGKGPLLGDEGSGHDIGVAALRAASRALDGRGPETQLNQLIRAHLGIEGVWGLVGKVYNPPLARHEIAGIAPLVSQAADAGDETARRILERAARELARMAEAALHRAEWAENPVPVLLAGGVLAGSRKLRHALEAELAARIPQAKITLASVPPVVGVALEGIARTRGERTPATLQRLLDTAPTEWRV